MFHGVASAATSASAFEGSLRSLAAEPADVQWAVKLLPQCARCCERPFSVRFGALVALNRRF